MWRIEFSSSEFLPYLPEQCQGNPGVYGFELAHWLSQALAHQGLITSYPLGEDWGWLIEFVEGEAEVMIGCASVAQDGDGYTGGAITWSVFVKPHRSLKQRLKGHSPEAAALRLQGAIVTALAARHIVVRDAEA